MTEKRKCLYHPAMKCPTPDKPCILAEACKTEKQLRTFNGKTPAEPIEM